MQQKRRHERFVADLPVKITVLGPKGSPRFEAHARLRDLSLGGAFVVSGFRFAQERDDLDVELMLPSGVVMLHSRVVRQPDGGLGLRFIDVGPNERQRLLKHLVPDSHKRFFADVAHPALPSLDLDRVSLLLHLWQEWQDDPEAAIRATVRAGTVGASTTRSSSPASTPRPAPVPPTQARTPVASDAKPTVASKPAVVARPIVKPKR